MAKKTSKKSSDAKPVDEEKVSISAVAEKPTASSAIKAEPKSKGNEVDIKFAEFGQLSAKFQRLDDAIERYMVRDELNELKTWLEKNGKSVNLP